MQFCQWYSNDSARGTVGEISIDVNGFRKPNTLGRDIFRFWIPDNGIAYPRGSQETSMVQYGDQTKCHWKTGDPAYNDCICGTKDGSTGYACTARVPETGKMDY